jgi:hypothetical protein
MNPIDPKVADAIKQIEAAYAGQASAHAYYAPAQKVYILVVSGDEAEAYRKAVTAIHDLAAHTKPHVKGA